MPTIKQLNQRHPSVDCKEISDLRALYEGGAAFRSKLKSFLLKRPNEPEQFYAIRLREAVYRNYVSPIVDYFTSLLFSSRPVAIPQKDGEPVLDADDFYSDFRDDADRSGGDVDAVCKWLLTEAMIARCGWLRLRHADDDGPAPATRAEFDSRGLGESWLERLTAEDVLDWDEDDHAGLAWAVTYSSKLRRGSLSSPRDQVTESWSHLLPDRVDVYSITYDADKPPSENDDVPLESSTPHRFGAVPLVCLDLPMGLWVVNRLESPQLGHFRLTNAQLWGMSTSCFAQPLFKLKSKKDPPVIGAGYGVILGAEESMEWMAPPSMPFDTLSKTISEHKDEIFRIAQNMALGVNNNAAAVGRTAESKQADAQATRVVLLAYSRLVKEALERAYDMISAARGDDLDWSIEGLDDFAAADISGLVDVLETVEKSGGIPSKTFNVEMKSRLAESLLPDMSQQTKQAIRTEIESNTEDPAEVAEREREQEEQRMEMLNRPAPQNQPPPMPRPAQA